MAAAAPKSLSTGLPSSSKGYFSTFKTSRSRLVKVPAVYVATHSTAPPANQVIKPESESLLLRCLRDKLHFDPRSGDIPGAELVTGTAWPQTAMDITAAAGVHERMRWSYLPHVAPRDTR
eukprot:gene14520-1145_t